MILRYITRTTKILENCDDARTAFIQETKNLEEYIEHETSRKCTNSFIVGMIFTAITFTGVIYFMSSDYGEFAKQLMKGI